MIDITKNEEEFYRLPGVTNLYNAQHTRENMAYKAMLFTPEDKFWAGDLREILWERYGIEIRPSDVGYGLRKLWEKNYVTRKKVHNMYRYEKTFRYHDAIREWMEVDE